MDKRSAEIESDLVDLSSLSIESLLSCDAELLASAMHRLMQRVDDVDGRFSTYNPSRTD